MSWLRLTANSNCFPIHIKHMQSVWAHWYAVHGYMAVASNSFTYLTWVRFWGSGSLVESKWCHYIMVGLTATSNCFPHPHYTYAKCLSASICYPWAYGSSLKQLYPHYLAQILGFCLTRWVKMMSLCHGWGWQPPQSASCIHIRHIKYVWAHWYAVHGYMAVASNSYTHTTWVRFWGSGSLVSQNDIILSWLRLIAPSNCFPHQH